MKFQNTTISLFSLVNYKFDTYFEKIKISLHNNHSIHKPLCQSPLVDDAIVKTYLLHQIRLYFILNESNK